MSEQNPCPKCNNIRFDPFKFIPDVIQCECCQKYRKNDVDRNIVFVAVDDIQLPGIPLVKQPLSFRSLDEMITIYMSFTDDMDKLFQNQVKFVNSRFASVASNIAEMEDFNREMTEVKMNYIKLDEQINNLQQYYNEIDFFLSRFECDCQKRFCLDPIDSQRIQIYGAVLDISEDIECMKNILSEIIIYINERYNTNDPIVQVVQVMASYIETLTWIDDNTTKMTKMLNDIESFNKKLVAKNITVFHRS